MITDKKIKCDGYTIYVCINDGMVAKGGQLIVYATLCMDKSTQHIYVGKTNQDDWEPWLKEAAAARVARGSPGSFGSVPESDDWKSDWK